MHAHICTLASYPGFPPKRPGYEVRGLYARMHTHTHGCPPLPHHTHTQRTNVRSSPNGGYAPPPPDQLRLGPLRATSGNSGPSARQTPEARPSTHRSTDYAPPLWCGHPNINRKITGSSPTSYHRRKKIHLSPLGTQPRPK